MRTVKIRDGFMSSTFDETRNFWPRSSAVLGLHLWHAPEMRMAHAPSCCHHLHGLSCMSVRGRLSMWTPGLSWAPRAAGLLAGRERWGVTCSLAPSVSSHPQTPWPSQHPGSIPVCLFDFVFLFLSSFVLWCRERNPGPHTCWASALPPSYTPDLPVSIVFL